MSARIEIGSKWGRWTVTRQTSPARRYNETRLRTRTIVRCVCGAEQTIFENDLRSGKSKGCKSSQCLARWHALAHVRVRLLEIEALVLDVLPAEIRDRMGDSVTLSRKEAAALLGCHLNTIKNRIARGDIRAVKNGRLVRVPASEIKRVLSVDCGPRRRQPETKADKEKQTAGHQSG